MSLGINGIGYNPYMNGLGSIGLGTSGSYGTYTDPLSSGMMGYSPYSMGGLGMMGMFNPSFMAQMTQTQQQIEQGQLQHASAMHELLLQNKTNAYKAEDKKIFDIAMVDAGLKRGIDNLAEKIKRGEQDAICEEFDKLKQTLYQKHGDFFKANSDKLNPDLYVSQFIEEMYNKLRTAKEGQVVDFRSELEKYRESAFEHGFWKNLHGKDYHDRYSAETINYLFGTKIDNKAGKDRMQKLGGIVESGVEYVAAPVIGLGVGAATGATLGGALKLFAPNCISEKISWNGFKRFGKIGAGIGAAALLLGDIMWQNSRA